MSRYLAAGLGEVLWDILPEGRKLGGAPANYAYFMNALGARAVVISRVGRDEPGDEALRLLTEAGLDISCITRDPDHPTGTVLASLNEHGHASYTFPDDVAWDHLTLSDKAVQLAADMNAVCFGTLAQRSQQSRRAVHDYLRAVPKECLKVFDVNLRGDFYGPGRITSSLELASVLKVSDEELPVLARLFSLGGTDAEQLEALRNRFDLTAVVLTRGEKGSMLLAGEHLSDMPGRAVRVADTIGAGDSFTAAVSMGLLAGWEAERVNRHAAEVAAYVCSCSGAMPPVPKELRVVE